MKVFRGNYDGRRYAVVAAKNQKDAAAALNMTVHSMRGFFYTMASHESEEAKKALACPGTVFVRGMKARKAEWLPI